MRHRALVSLVSGSCLLLTGLTGCEGLQRKFTRKPKHPQPPPTPIVKFLDYSKAMTPLDRYRKHSLMFDYWNDALLEALQSPPLNPKRYRRASTEALGELETLKGLVSDELAARLAPLIEERAKIDRQLQGANFSANLADVVRRALEVQTRAFERGFYWRDVEDQLKETGPRAETPTGASPDDARSD